MNCKDFRAKPKFKICFIVPYFGKLPHYFQIFLDSCEWNPDYEWMIFTNDDTDYKYPDNVHRIQMTFSDCKKLIQTKFDFQISLNSPQKLCDYRPAYGLIFSDYLIDYDWWGHCDLDQIFGILGHFITEEMLQKCCKIGSLGHLTLYKNTEENNRIFLNELHGNKRYVDVFTTEYGCAFDEWLPGNINEIFLESRKLEGEMCLANFGADINPYQSTLTICEYNVQKRMYAKSKIKNSIFVHMNGEIRQLYIEDGRIVSKEFAYIHLQKRKMSDCREDLLNRDSYYIIPNKFVQSSLNPRKLLTKSAKYLLFNFQYFAVKWNSLKWRIKTDNWKFNSVFRPMESEKNK